MYEYACTECGHSVDKLVRASDPEPTECPECGKHGLKRQISAAAFALKGTGWYVTDFRNKKKPSGASKDGKKEGKDSKAPKDKAASGGKNTASAGTSASGDKGGKPKGGGSGTQTTPD